MMAPHLFRLIAFLTAWLVIATTTAFAQSALTQSLVDALGPGSFPQHEAAIAALVATGDPKVAPILEALSDGNLYLRKSDSRVAIGSKAGDGLDLKDPVSGTDLGQATTDDVEKIKDQQRRCAAS